MFTVDSEFQIGAKRIPNEEVADAARENSDIMMAFAQHRSAQGQDGRARGAALIKDGVIKRLQVSSDLAGFFPERSHGVSAVRGRSPSTSCRRFSTAVTRAWVPACPAAAGLRLKYSNPIHLDDVAADFPDMNGHHRASVLAVAGRGAVGVPAQAQRLHRPVGLVAEIFPAAAHPVRELAAQDQDAVRLGLSAHHARIAGSRISRKRASSPRCTI